MNIAILDDFQDIVRKMPCIHKVVQFNTRIYTSNAKGIAQLTDRLKDIDVIILNQARTEITRQLLERLDRLKLIIQIGPVGPHLDVAACTDLNIPVIAGEESCIATAEFTWALIMSTMRRIPQYTSMLKHGGWQQSGLKQQNMPPNFSLGTTLCGKTLGIWGFNPVGQQLAQYGKAFGMRVIVWGSEEDLRKVNEAGYQPASAKQELLEESDVLSMHLNFDGHNSNVVQLSDFSLMKPTSLFVNTAHAGLVDTQTLVAALKTGTPGLAAIDVFDTEPIMKGHALLRLENAICTPHIGNLDKENLELYYDSAFNHVVDFYNKNSIPSTNLVHSFV